MVSTPSAGWYDDPTDPERRRWWDGSAWSEDTQPRSAAPAPGLAEQPATGVVPAGAGAVVGNPAAAVRRDVDAETTDGQPRTSSRGRVIAGVLVAALAVASVGWLAYRKIAAARLSGPATTSAEMAWVAAGTEIGSAALGQGVAADQVDAYCDGTYATLAESGRPELADVPVDRARALFTDACRAVARGVPQGG